MDSRTTAMLPRHLPDRVPWAAVCRLEPRVEAIGFWAAVTIPGAYLWLLASGIDGRGGLGLFVALLGLHLVALIVGHGYGDRRVERPAVADQ
ncbi:MAG: hypothetical protein U5J98_05375 [Halobacteriales archaeon]|nr:hypothetical protein [Halobacteriales archaeon]